MACRRPGKVAIVGAILGCLVSSAAAGRGEEAAQPPGSVVLENDLVKYVLSPEGKNLAFVDKQSGKDYLAAPGGAFAAVTKAAERYEPTACRYADGKLTLEFQPPGITAVIGVAAKPHYFALELLSISDADVDEMLLLSLPVTSARYTSGISGVAADDQFAAALRTLNLQVLGSVGGSPAVLSARAYRRYGLVGAKWTLAGGPAGAIRGVLKEIVHNEGLPESPLGGPWALDAPENRGSYVFASVSEKNVDQWIALAQRGGIAEIHFISWERSLGHYEPRADLFPGGLAGLKAVVDKIHAAGLKAGMHTLTGCISPGDPWATPVPDKRLANDGAFTLTEPLDEKQDTLLTAEQPPEYDTIWAYGSHGNVLRIDEELVEFTGLSRSAPFGFTGCRRGALGTKPAPHAKGAAVHHLFVRYGSFLPDEDSTLVDDVAAAIGNVFNTCGFDMIYMDGAEGMCGGWHGVARMREAIFRKLNRRALVEASEWGYQSWPFHSRLGAWDYPNWGLKRFIDVHCRATEDYRRSAMLPAQLGWWAILGPGADQPAETPDEIEYLCAKALALDAPMSFQGIDVGDHPWNARQNEYLDLIGRYERLRLAGYFPQAVRDRLKAEEDFRLVELPGGAWKFLPTDYAVHKVTALDDGSAAWTARNRFAAQPLRLRIEALYGVEPYDAAGSLVLADFGPQDGFAPVAAAPAVTQELVSSTEQVKIGQSSGRFTARSTAAARRGAWAQAKKTFTPHADLRPYGALGVWIHGDGRGEVLNLQLTNPTQYWPTYDEHYVTVDFTGWRYFELLLGERDAAAYGRYAWPYGDIYSVYRSPLIRDHTSALSLYFNELAPGESTVCYLSPVKALKTVPLELKNPSVSVGGKPIVFPVTLKSGGYVEFESPSECNQYDERGALIGPVQVQGDVPGLAAGDNQVGFTCEGPAGLRARAQVTIISCGEVFP